MSKCSCLQHENFVGEQQFTVYNLITGKKIKKAIVTELIERNLLSKKSKYLCNVCAQYCEENFIKKNPNISSKPTLKNVQESFEITLMAIKNNDLSEEQISKLSVAIGASQRSKISQDIENIDQDYKDDDLLKSYDPNAWMEGRNPVVLSFLKALSSDSKDPKIAVRLVQTIEAIYSLQNKSLVLPFSFSRNIETYFLTGSKLLCNVNGKLSPAGCYSTVLSWIEAYGNEPISLTTDGDVLSYFDNNQVLCRNWRVRLNAKAVVSVITQLVHFLPVSNVSIQKDVTLSPRNWLYNTENSEVVDKILEFQSSFGDTFRSFRQLFIEDRIKSITKNQKIVNGSMTDNIDDCVNIQPPQKIAKKDYVQTDVYNVIPSCHHPVKVVTGNPIMLNPCSYKSVQKIIEKISEETSVGEHRKWTIVGCDGLPYVLGSKLVAEEEKLQDILLQPGVGHYEMNMTKAVIHLLWDVVGTDLAKLLGFRSPKAMQAFHDAHDHHKAWQIVEILLFGTADELLLPFIRECYDLDNNVPLSSTDYFQWASRCCNPNYTFLMESVFTYLLALYLHRIGIRRNNSKYMLCGRIKFSPLLYGTNKTNYQKIEFLDLKTRVLSPPPVQNFQQQNETMSASGHASKGEGFDFVVEAKNKKTKSWIPSGAPTEEQWTRVCRNIDRLEKVQENMKKHLDISEANETEIYHCNLHNEITSWKTYLRQKQYLSTPFHHSEHHSLSGKPLDHELTNFSTKCKNNMIEFYNDIRRTNQIQSGNLEPIFIFKSDRIKYHSIDKKTKNEIQTLILEEIETFKDLEYEEEADMLEKKWKTQIKGTNKAGYIKFFKEVKALFDEVTSADYAASRKTDNPMPEDVIDDSASNI